MKTSKDENVKKAGLIAFALLAIVTVFSMATNLGEAIDRDMRNIRYALQDKEPSGEIIFVAMDDQSLREIGEYPWSRETHANLINRLQDEGVDRLAFDIGFIPDSANPAHDKAFANAISNSSFPIGIAVPGNDDGGNTDPEKEGSSVRGMWPKQAFLDAGAEPFSIWTNLNGDGQFEFGEHSVLVDGEPMTPIAKWLIDQPGGEGRYYVDWNLDPRDIISYSYADILKGRHPEGALEGKKLIVAADASVMGDFVPMVTGEYAAGGRTQVIAAETLLSGERTILSEVMIATLFLFFCGVIMATLTPVFRYPAYFALAAIAMISQWTLETLFRVSVPSGDALLVIGYTIVASITVDIIRYFYGRMTKNEGTGLPNLMAMKSAPKDKGSTIVLTVSNHLDILSELGSEGRDKIMLKVAQRIEMGSNGKQVYQVDASSFAWKGSGNVDDDSQQIESILALLRAGVSFASSTIDVFASAGIEENDSIPVDKAVNNAGIAAVRANSRGIAWEVFQADDSDEHWKISVVAEITKAIENNDLWVAYQPKVDSKTDKIIGAEALVRWKHPTRGDVRPDAFIPMLEKANRTEDLTRFMLDRATADFSKLPGCTVAVNVSPLMIGYGALTKMVKEALEKNNLDPQYLTIEITESERFTNPKTVAELEEVHNLGVKISIDDYGMGNSTVNYLRILPADELKIDRSFISNVLANKSDKVVVASTIQLAHQMGMQVVAEGVESADIQSYLHELECDFIQGYHTGKPVNFDEFQGVIEMVNAKKADAA